MNILHIAAHLGGGAGKAISGIAIQGRQDFSDEHKLLLLQKPEKSGYFQECQANGVQVIVWDGESGLMEWADVAVVSWWDHPAMAQFLRELPPARAPLVLWSHVNGCHYPLLPAVLADEFDRILLTSPYSLEAPFWSPEERERIRAKSEIVWGMGRFTPEKLIPRCGRQNRSPFTVGYVGTLNYGKIHPNFAAYCKEAQSRVPDVRFVLAGDRDAALERDIRSVGLADRVSFTGFVSDVPALMRTFDVFGYLLNPEHYGTTENVLLEAMACGLPVAVLRQNVEQYIVPPSAGRLVETPRQYAHCLQALQRDPALCERLGRGAREHVLRRYRTPENAARFRDACAQALCSSSRSHDFSFLGDSPWEWFLFCLGPRERSLMEEAKVLLEHGGSSARIGQLLKNCPPILREERKSSLRHFATTYPQDETLQQLKRYMEQE